MLTDDKVNKNELDVYDNVNTRDQNRTMIILFVLLGLFLAGMVGLGLSHSPQKPEEHAQETGVSGNPVGAQESDSNFSVRKPVAEVELPGTIGKPQRWTVNGTGNTPVTSKAADTSTSTATDANSEAPKADEKPAAAPAGH